MPLSDEEQRLLEQMERALAAEDPKFASALRGGSLRSRSRRRAIAGAAGFLLGVVLLMVGVIIPQTVVSVLGFVIMVFAAYVTVNAVRRASAPDLGVVDPSGSTRAPKHSGRSGGNQPGSFMQRMEERWRRRRESGF